MKRAGAVDLGHLQVAFWGYTNGRGADAAVNLARQLRRCQDALGGHAEINNFFYDTPEPVDELMALAVRGAGGPPHHDGGWDDLTAALPAAGRGFEAIICERVDRVSRVSSRFFAREQLAAEHGVAIVAANEPILALADIREQGAARLQRHTRRSAHEYDYATATSARRRPRRCAGG